MTPLEVTHSSSGDVQQHLDGLIARYSVLGAERRRKRRRAWVARGLVAASAVGAAVAAALVDWQIPVIQPTLDELRAMRSTLTTELEAFQAGRAELEQQRARLERQSAELSSRLLEFDRRAAALEAESSSLREQTARLEAALARIDEERRALLAAASSAESQRQVASIEQEQRGLERQREAFVAQQSELSSELDLLARRRLELEERRQALEAQRRELESLLAGTGRGAPSEAPMTASSAAEASSDTPVPAAEPRPASETASDSETPAADSASDFTIASTISPESLGDMRGGIMLGEGMNVSIGLLRSASINGVEQVTNTFTLEGLNRNFGDLATSTFAPVVIQNGPGNFIDPSLLTGVPGFSGTIIQNTLDDQLIDISNVFDVSITDVSSATDGVAAGQALRDSLYFHQ